jgi:hypothetical protein
MSSRRLTVLSCNTTHSSVCTTGSPLGTSATICPFVPAPDECGAVGGMRKPAPMLLCPPQIPFQLTWDQSRAAAVEAGD